MTYGELAHTRGIDRQSAVKLVRRQRWRRQPGNHGEVRVFVPLDGLSRPTARDEAPEETRVGAPPMTWDTTAFEAALAAIKAAHASEVAALREQANATELSRVTTQALADRLAAQLTDITARIEQAECRADLANRRTAQAETRAEGFRLSVEELRAGQTLMVDLHARDLNAARAIAEAAQRDAQVAQDAAEALRRETAARKARGRLRRVWDGWRGR